jgi:hypothetical protein
MPTVAPIRQGRAFPRQPRVIPALGFPAAPPRYARSERRWKWVLLGEASVVFGVAEDRLDQLRALLVRSSIAPRAAFSLGGVEVLLELEQVVSGGHEPPFGPSG